MIPVIERERKRKEKKEMEKGIERQSEKEAKMYSVSAENTKYSSSKQTSSIILFSLGP